MIHRNIVIAAVVGFVVTGAVVVFPLCNGESCSIQGWMSASSGWVAALAAFITLRVLYSQADAAHVQTEFMVGNARPTIDAVQHASRPKFVVLRLRNWNRRSMIVREIRLAGAETVTFMHLNVDKRYLKRQGIDHPNGLRFYSSKPSIPFNPALLVEGWVNRNDAPMMLKLGLAASRTPADYLDEDWSKVGIVVVYEMVGEAGIVSQTARVHLVTSATTVDEGLYDISRDADLDL